MKDVTNRRGHDHPEGWKSAVCTKGTHNGCASLRCACECHKRCAK